MSREICDWLGIPGEVHWMNCGALQFSPDNRPNLIMTSPPYADRRKTTYGGHKPEEYVEWFLTLSEKFLKDLTDDGSFILNIKENCDKGERLLYVYELIIALKKQGWCYIDDYAWVKNTSIPGKWPNRFRDGWEHCFHLTKNKKFKMRQERVMVPLKESSKTRYSRITDKDLKNRNSATGSGFIKKWENFKGREVGYPDNVLTLHTESCNVGHPAAYPLALPSWFIELFTDPGDVVFDPFAGSGTTILAAQNLLRKGIGTEQHPDYFNVAEDRIRKEWKVIPKNVSPV